MNKLTGKDLDPRNGYHLNCDDEPNCTDCRTCERMAEAIDRLGKYENSELTPEMCTYFATLDSDNRLIILDYKIGDRVYTVEADGVQDWGVQTIRLNEHGISYTLVHDGKTRLAQDIDIYSTREAAEKDLLKPCPLCGGGAKLVGGKTVYRSSCSGYDTTPVYVECKSCHAEGPKFAKSDAGAAVKAWNKRALNNGT